MRRKNGNRSKRPLGDPVNVGKRLVADDHYDTEVDEIDVSPDALPAVVEHVWMPALPDTLALVDELDDDDSAGRLWTHLCKLLIESNMLTEGDLFLLEQFVMAALEANRAYFQLRTEGSVVATADPGGGRPAKTTHPAYRVWRDSQATMLKLAEHFALTPLSRTRLGLALGKGRKLQQELGDGLPENPVKRDGDTPVDTTATDIDDESEA